MSPTIKKKCTFQRRFRYSLIPQSGLRDQNKPGILFGVRELFKTLYIFLVFSIGFIPKCLSFEEEQEDEYRLTQATYLMTF